MTKRTKKRPYSQDFSVEKYGRITDSSFAKQCDVNNIVKHYEATGLDPFVERQKLAQGTAENPADATTTSFEQAMRNKADLDSAFMMLPESERLQHDNNAMAWYEYLNTAKAPQAPPEDPSAHVELAPQDSTEAESID